MTAVSSQPRGSRFPSLEKYDVLEELGHGGMATVYRARDLRLGRDVALKVIHPHLRDSAEAVRRFSIEARAVAMLRHPNIVEVYDVSSASEPEQYLVVELVRGRTLRQLLDLHGALPAEVAASIAVELLGAIAHAHEAGVIHRDVKPENVILEHRASPESESRVVVPTGDVRVSPVPPDAGSAPLDSATIAAAGRSLRPRSSEGPGDRVTLKLTDFGIAKLLDARGVTSTGQVLGSPAHMAPEQIEGREVDGRADIFGIGVLMYECMVGHLPFEGTNPAQVLRRVLEGEYPSAERERPTIGRTWSRVLDEALAPEVTARFAGAPEMRDVLVKELARLGVTSPRAEIERWLDDPEGFVRIHEATMTARLCAKGDESARRGDALAAASDYNRALAYAPHDAALLRLVAKLNRRTASRDLARRFGPYVILTLLFSIAGFYAGPYLRRTLRAIPVETAAIIDPPPLTPPLPAPTLNLPPPETAASARTLARPSVGPRPPPRPASREFRFALVLPAQGVLVAVDGAAPVAVDPTRPLVVDDKAHALVFTCTHDLCDPLARAIDPGDRGGSLSVHLTIHPSKLLIRGNPGNHYVLGEDPTRLLQASEVANVIAMKDESSRVVKVNEVETGQSRSVELRAGQASKPVDFTAPP